VLPRCLIFLIVGLVLPATPAWSSDQDFLTAEKLYRANEFSRAEKLYSQVDFNNANYPVAQHRLGTIYYLTERPVQAEKCFSTYLRFKESPGAYCLLAGTQFNQREFNLATSSAQRALQLDHNFAKAYTVLGMIHTAEKDFANAQAAYREALKLNDNDSDTWFMLGQALFLHDDFAEAARAFDRALEINPQSLRIYDNLARTKDILGDLKGAEECYKEGLKASRAQNFFDPNIYVGYGEFLLKLDRLADSQRVVEEGLRTAPRNAGLHYELSKAQIRIDTRQPGLFRHICEGSVAVVMEQIVAIDPHHVEVFPPVVIIVCGGNTHGVSIRFDSGPLGNVRKSAVAIVAVEAVVIFRPRLLEIRNSRPVDEVEIGKAIVVVIENCDAGHHRLDLIFPGCGAVVEDEMNSGRRRDVLELNGGWSWAGHPGGTRAHRDKANESGQEQPNQPFRSCVKSHL